MILTIPEVQRLGGYRIIYADPPWGYSDKGIRGGTKKHYSTMSVDQICALPVKEIAAQDSALFLWGTYPMMPDALAVMGAWGFRYKTIAFQWVKMRGAKPFFGLGHWTRGNSEPCFLGVRGSPKRIDAGVAQLVMSEVGRHSAKPPEVRDRIVRLMGPLPRIELFAREKSTGWDVWGNEVVPSITFQPGGSNAEV